MLKDFKLITLNVQSIKNHKTRIALQHLLDTHKPDVMTCCETWLDDRHQLILTGYDVSRCDRNAR